MTHMAMVYRRPVGVLRHSVKRQLASWEWAGHPSQVKLARFLAHVDAIADPVLARVSGRIAAELIVGFGDGVSARRKQHAGSPALDQGVGSGDGYPSIPRRTPFPS
jgi:hypothetical protein